MLLWSWPPTTAFLAELTTLGWERGIPEFLPSCCGSVAVPGLSPCDMSNVCRKQHNIIEYVRSNQCDMLPCHPSIYVVLFLFNTYYSYVLLGTSGVLRQNRVS